MTNDYGYPIISRPMKEVRLSAIEAVIPALVNFKDLLLRGHVPLSEQTVKAQRALGFFYDMADFFGRSTTTTLTTPSRELVKAGAIPEAAGARVNDLDINIIVISYYPDRADVLIIEEQYTKRRRHSSKDGQITLAVDRQIRRSWQLERLSPTDPITITMTANHSPAIHVHPLFFMPILPKDLADIQGVPFVHPDPKEYSNRSATAGDINRLLHTCHQGLIGGPSLLASY